MKLGGNSQSNCLGLYPYASYHQVTGLDCAQNYMHSGSKLLPFIGRIITPTELQHSIFIQPIRSCDMVNSRPMTSSFSHAFVLFLDFLLTAHSPLFLVCIELGQHSYSHISRHTFGIVYSVDSSCTLLPILNLSFDQRPHQLQSSLLR